jgi:transposase InsO family protein
VTDAFPWDEAPRHLIRDRDSAFGPAYLRRIRAMRIRDHPTAPRSPWQNGHVERFIGSIRREALDHLIVFGEAQLRRVLKKYASYYNQTCAVALQLLTQDKILGSKPRAPLTDS